MTFTVVVGLSNLSWATDRSGNVSAPISLSFTIDLTAPSPPVLQSPPDRAIVTSGTVEIRGVAEPGSTIEMVFGGGFEAQADPVSGKFVFGGIKLQPGDNIFIFTAKDRAGNVSGATSYKLILSAEGVPSANVTLDRGKYTQNEVVFITSTIQNSIASDTFPDLTARVSVVNGQGVALFKDETPIPSLRPGQVFEFQTHGRPRQIREDITPSYWRLQKAANFSARRRQVSRSSPCPFIRFPPWTLWAS